MLNYLPLLFALARLSLASSGRTIYDFTVKDAAGKPVSMDEYRGQVLLIVNVASQCGLTDSNYRQLKVLEDDYGSKGFAIAAFPCNQFGYQEPSSEADIMTFVSERFEYAPRLFAKIAVNGDDADPLWVFLKEEQGGTLVDAIKWNFTKFLIDRNGRVVARFAPTTEPFALRAEIERLLRGKEGEQEGRSDL
ncbi:gpx-7 [Pristionchus pacificus]|nr:gpx-7 [Pristionchus pacificus]